MSRDPRCNLDIDGCTGNEGEPCDDCARWRAEEEAYWTAYFKVPANRPQSRKEYAQEVHDSGRGHLLNEEESAEVDRG